MYCTHATCSTVEVTQALARSKLCFGVASSSAIFAVVVMGSQCTDEMVSAVITTAVPPQLCAVYGVRFNTLSEDFSFAVPKPA